MSIERKTAICNAIFNLYFEQGIFSREILNKQGLNVSREEFEDCLRSISESVKLSKNENGRSIH